MNGTDWLAQLLFPPKCVLCGALLPWGQTDLCHRCRAEAPWTEGARKQNLPYVADWTAVWYYEGAVRRSILRFKLGAGRSYADSYGRLLAVKLFQDFPEGFDLLTWVPISRRRQLSRGYNQAALLAGSVGRELGMEPVALLRKVRHNAHQADLPGAAQRRANVLGAYSVVKPDLAAGQRILLLDDILTTGATASECARMLLTAGAAEVICAVMACGRHNFTKR